MSNPVLLGADAAAWRTRLAAIRRKQETDACTQVAELLNREQERRTSERRRADVRISYTVTATELQDMGLQEFELLATLLTARLETAPEQFEVLSRVHLFPRTVSRRWQKWENVSQDCVEEVIAEVTRLVEVERSKRAKP